MRKTHVFVLLALCAASFMQGQATLPAAAPATAPAVIHVYRTGSMYGIALRPSIYCDGGELIRLAAADYVDFSIPPGMHTISAGRSESVIIRTFEAGKDYYYKLSFKKMNMLEGTQTPAVLAPVSNETWDHDTRKLEERPVKRGASCGTAVKGWGTRP